jgi:hypothetical protein
MKKTMRASFNASAAHAYAESSLAYQATHNGELPKRKPQQTPAPRTYTKTEIKFYKYDLVYCVIKKNYQGAINNYKKIESTANDITIEAAVIKAFDIAINYKRWDLVETLAENTPAKYLDIEEIYNTIIDNLTDIMHKLAAIRHLESVGIERY